MSIPFTQYLRPNGRKREEQISRSAEIEESAQRFITSGGWFECEELSDGTVSLTACRKIDHEPQDIVIRLVPNGPDVPAKVDELVKAAEAWRQQ